MGGQEEPLDPRLLQVEARDGRDMLPDYYRFLDREKEKYGKLSKEDKKKGGCC